MIGRRPRKRLRRALPKMSDEDAALARDAVRTAQQNPAPTNPDGELNDDVSPVGEDDAGEKPPGGRPGSQD